MNKYDMAVARLKAAANLELTPVYRKGQLAEIKVRVQNIRAGHNLPTSLANIRQMWLEMTATDEKGNIVMSSVPEDIDLQAIYGLAEVPTLPVVEMVSKVARFNTRR